MGQRVKWQDGDRIDQTSKKHTNQNLNPEQLQPTTQVGVEVKALWRVGLGLWKTSTVWCRSCSFRRMAAVKGSLKE